MDPIIIAAICSAVAAIIGAFLGFVASNRQIDADKDNIAEQNKVLVYKVDELINDVKHLAAKLDEYSKEIISVNFRLATLEANSEDMKKRLEKLEASEQSAS